MKKILLLIFVGCLFTACSSDDDWESGTGPEGEVKELKLSTEANVSIDGIDYEFEILEGNGGYAVRDANDEFAKVTITGTKVKVDLLKNNVNVIITDKEGKEALVNIYSSAESLIPNGYGLITNVDSVYVMKDINFGAGGYTLEKIKGTSAEAIVTEDDYVKVTGVKPGKSFYKIKDKRGSTAKLEVVVTDNYDYTGDDLEINTTNEQIINVIFKSGTGWKIASDPSTPIFKRVVLHTKGHLYGYDTLQIDTSEDNEKGIAVIHLQDDAGNKAYITVYVK